MPRGKARNPSQASFVENFGTTAPAVPAVRQAVSEWKAGGYKGMEDIEVASKDRAAAYWAENATALTGTPWGYVKVRQGDFTQMQPTTFEDCAVMGGMTPEMFD